MLVCRAVGLMTLLLVAAVRPTQTSAEPERVHIRYAAPMRCPDSAAFMRALHQQTERFRLVASSEQVRAFLVTINQTETLVSGRLEIRTPGADLSSRSIAGKTCDEIVAALAFMTALAIEPSVPGTPLASPPSPSTPTSPPTAGAHRAAGSPAPEPTTDPPSGPADSAASRPDPVSRTARPLASVTPAAPPTAAASPTAERRKPNPAEKDDPPSDAPVSVVAKRPAAAANARTAEEWKWSAGLQAGTSLGMSPTPGLGGLLFVEAAAPGDTRLGPVLRAGIFISQSDANLASGAQAEFQWAAAMLEGCPLRLAEQSARLGLDACLAFHLGVLRGQGQHLDQPAKTTDLWADLGPVARIRVVVSSRVFLEAQGMLVLPLRRLTYEVHDAGPAQPATTAYVVPSVGALARIGVAYQFR